MHQCGCVMLHVQPYPSALGRGALGSGITCSDRAIKAHCLISTRQIAMRIGVAAFDVLCERGVIGDCQKWLAVPPEWNAIHALGMNALPKVPSLALTF